MRSTSMLRLTFGSWPSHGLTLLAASLFFLNGCGNRVDGESRVNHDPSRSATHVAQVADVSDTTTQPTRDASRHDEEALTDDERATLESLRKVHDYPLYVMTYHHDYKTVVAQSASPQMQEGFACSLFAAFHGPDGSLMGRNFDWNESPALLLFTKPDQGYASVSMVDISYLGYNQFNLDELDSVEGRRRLLRAPLIPFDGMNDQGLTVAMAAVPDAAIPTYENKPTIVSVTLMRLMLDQAKTVDEALELVDDYNIDFAGGPNIHYLVADRQGNSALIELKHRRINVHRNEHPWQIATNFYLTGVIGEPEHSCDRYAKLSARLIEHEGKISLQQAMDSLENVAQPSTRWSMLYRMDALEAQLVLNRNYDAPYVISLQDQTIKRQSPASAASSK